MKKVESEEPIPAVKPHKDDTVTLIYTSGTTGSDDRWLDTCNGTNNNRFDSLKEILKVFKSLTITCAPCFEDLQDYGKRNSIRRQTAPYYHGRISLGWSLRYSFAYLCHQPTVMMLFGSFMGRFLLVEAWRFVQSGRLAVFGRIEGLRL
jgi:hypothetical protein